MPQGMVPVFQLKERKITLVDYCGMCMCRENRFKCFMQFLHFFPPDFRQYRTSKSVFPIKQWGLILAMIEDFQILKIIGYIGIEDICMLNIQMRNNGLKPSGCRYDVELGRRKNHRPCSQHFE